MKYLLPLLSFVIQTWAHNHFGPVVFRLNGPIQPYNIPRRTYNHLYHAQRPDSVHVVNYHQGCPDLLQPICATNGEVFLHFRNKCFLSNYNYQALIRGHREYLECPMQLCFSRCPPCPHVVEPICGLDLKTQELRNFKNVCEMQRAACNLGRDFRVQHRGHCSPNRQCPRFCPKFHQPVCAAFGKEVREFQNSCELQRSRCQSKIDWVLLNQGPCRDNNYNNRLPHPFHPPYQPFAFGDLSGSSSNHIQYPSRPQHPREELPLIIEYIEVPQPNHPVPIKYAPSLAPQPISRTNYKPQEVPYNQPTYVKLDPNFNSYANPSQLYHEPQKFQQGPPPTNRNINTPIYSSKRIPKSLSHQPVCGKISTDIARYPGLQQLEEEAKRRGEAWSVLPIWLCDVLSTINPVLSFEADFNKNSESNDYKTLKITE
ncbi:uncharacterized protein LOC109613012 [Musca domestica]|uniref:Uncharacterized protein LOC109613012 n=1 Tax=Musca domestica TaxID=7370 RepID=A0ABM3VCS6_MUSDO|nr:uncharacterized protein LOC109613012 [Musca domestica]